VSSPPTAESAISVRPCLPTGRVVVVTPSSAQQQIVAASFTFIDTVAAGG
jgi:hypothetical protein